MTEKKLSSNQYELIEETMRQRITEWTNEVNNLMQKINGARETLSALKDMSEVSPNGHKLQVDSKLEIILRIFREAKQKWIPTGYVRDQYRTITGEDLAKSTLRHYLKGYGPYRFERRGKTRTTRWKLIDAIEGS